MELGQPGIRVGDDHVEVIREYAEGVHPDIAPVCRDREEVLEDFVTLLRGPENEATLGAAASDEVGGARQDLSRKGHGRSQWQAACRNELPVYREAYDGRPSARRTHRLPKLLSVGALKSTGS